MARRRVHVVPHTHWDREWYLPFQAFRLRLVDVVDELLDVLEADPAFAHFHLDGQVAAVDDYLALRPHEEARIRRMNGDGRLAIGPWYVLMDEFLASPETIVRNLQLGRSRGEDLGGTADVGYLPDSFGHVAQMPQLLRLAGIEHAVVWRGVPRAVRASAFWWTALDGSTVRAERLVAGYGNGAGLPREASAAAASIAAHVAEVAEAIGDGPLLLMNGTDHQPTDPSLPSLITAITSGDTGLDAAIVPLRRHLETAPTNGLVTVSGELRSGARAPLLMGVASNRLDIRQAAAITARDLERLAEPLSTLFLDDPPQAALAEAWRAVILNSAHDSICACSHDDVGRAVLHRYDEARAIAGEVTGRAAAALARSLRNPGPVVVNASARRRGGLVELTVPATASVAGAQTVWERGAETTEREVDAEELRAVLGHLRGQLYGDDFVNRIEIDDSGDRLEVSIAREVHLRPDSAVEERKRELFVRTGSDPGLRATLRLQRQPARRVVCRVDDVPGYGWQRWRPRPLAVAPVAVAGTTVTNGIVTVVADCATGTFTIDGVAGFGRLVDGGDHGDTYNHSPPEHDTVVDAPSDVVVEVAESGPVRARLRVTAAYVWPERIDDASGVRTGSVTVPIVTSVEVVAGERLVRLTTSFDNRVRDHRLRVHLPLPTPAATSRAECAFGTVDRPLWAEGSDVEAGLPTFPSRRFVEAGGLTVVHEGLHEYELVDVDPVTGWAHTLALTLVRATGMLSRAAPSGRRVPAGPIVALAGPQVQGPVEVRYGVQLGASDPYALVDDLSLPLLVEQGAGGGDRRDDGAVFTVTGAEVSALRRDGHFVELRVFNPSPSPTTVDIGRPGQLVDLCGRQLAPTDGQFDLRGFGIATVRMPIAG